MESTQQKPRTLRQALNRGGKSDSASDGPRRLSDYVTRRPKTLADVRRITSLLESSAVANNKADEALNEAATTDPAAKTKPGCSGTADKPCGCKSCGGTKENKGREPAAISSKERSGASTSSGSNQSDIVFVTSVKGGDTTDDPDGEFGTSEDSGAGGNPAEPGPCKTVAKSFPCPQDTYVRRNSMACYPPKPPWNGGTSGAKVSSYCIARDSSGSCWMYTYHWSWKEDATGGGAWTEPSNGTGIYLVGVPCPPEGKDCGFVVTVEVCPPLLDMTEVQVFETAFPGTSYYDAYPQPCREVPYEIDHPYPYDTSTTDCTPVPPPWPPKKGGEVIATRCCTKDDRGECTCYEITWEWRPIADTNTSDGHFAWHRMKPKEKVTDVDCDMVKPGYTIVVTILDCPPTPITGEHIAAATNLVLNTRYPGDYSVEAVEARIPVPEAETPEEDSEPDPEKPPCKKVKRRVWLPINGGTHCRGTPPPPDWKPCGDGQSKTVVVSCRYELFDKCYESRRTYRWVSGMWVYDKDQDETLSLPCNRVSLEAGTWIEVVACPEDSVEQITAEVKSHPMPGATAVSVGNLAFSLDSIADLPDCPCEVDVASIPDGWCKGSASESFHPGAEFCLRQLVPDVDVTKLPGGAFGGFSLYPAGQQCCYAKDGSLITSGAAAGTPDIIGTAVSRNEKGECETGLDDNVAVHFFADVAPWLVFKGLGWLGRENSYNFKYPPNPGLCCKLNHVNG